MSNTIEIEEHELALSFKQWVQFCLGQWRRARKADKSVTTPLFLLGPPGIGKTAVGKDLAQAIEASVLLEAAGEPKAQTLGTPNREASEVSSVKSLFFAADLSAMLPEDLGGIPMPTNHAEWDLLITRYAIQEWLAPFCREGAVGVLVLDDITQAAGAVQVATRQLVNQRRLGSFRLSDGVYLMVTGNRRQDGAKATKMPSHFLNTCIVGSLRPSVDEWLAWHGRQEGVEPRVASYFRFRSTKLVTYPKDADKQTGAFCTPRSAARLSESEVFQTAKEQGCLLHIAAGCIGRATALDMVAFFNTLSELASPEDVLRDPKAAMPNPVQDLDKMDKSYAMITALAETAAKWSKGKDVELADAAPGLFMAALGWVAQTKSVDDRGFNRNREFIGVGIQTFEDNGGDVFAFMRASRELLKSNPHVREVIDFMKETSASRPGAQSRRRV